MDDGTGEVWRPVPGYERTYEASSLGRIRSLPRAKTKGQVLKPSTNRVNGYLYLNLVQEGIQKTFNVHTVVTLTFLGPRPAGLQVRHLDGNPGNPRLDNLTYGTASENARDQRRHGTDPRLNKTHCLHGHEFTPDNTVYNTAGARCCRTCRRLRSARARATIKN